MQDSAANSWPGFRHLKIRWGWTVAWAFSLLTVILVIYGLWRNFIGASTVDFVSFWAAGHLSLNGAPASAYNIAIHREVELSTGGLRGGLNPFPYPPPFLFFVIPFAALPYFVSFAAWMGVTISLYLWSTRRIVPLPYSLVHSAALVNALIGQNGFLTSAIFIFGMSQLSTRPFLAGATLGLLIIKPQLALTLPVAFLAGREWRGIAGGVVSGAFMLLAALVVFGASTYQAFFDILPKYTEFMSQNRLPWNELASVFAFCRFVGIPQTPAAVVQALVALAAIFVTWRAWRRDLDTKIPILAAATLLLPPYLYTYDTLLLILPLGWFILHGHRRTLVAILWLLCFLPFIAYDYTWPGPTTIPIAAILSIWFLYKDARANSNALPEPTPGPATATSV